MSAIIDWLMAHQSIIWGALFAMSELIGLSPKVAASGVFQAIYNFLKARAGK